MSHAPRLDPLLPKPQSWWQRIALPLAFVAGGLTFIGLPSLLASRADADGPAQRTAAGPPIGFRDSGPVDLLRSADIRFALDRIRADSRGVTFETSADGRAQFVLNRRAESSEPEVHAEWDDVFFFQSGVGRARYGGQIRGATARGAKEQRGGEIVGAITSTVAPGDVMRIPAGVPHQIEPLGDAPIVYLVVKVKAPLKLLPVDSAPAGAFIPKP